MSFYYDADDDNDKNDNSYNHHDNDDDNDSTDDRISDDDAIVINNNLHEKLSISVKLYDYLSLLYIFVCMFVWIIGAFFQWQF